MAERSVMCVESRGRLIVAWGAVLMAVIAAVVSTACTEVVTGGEEGPDKSLYFPSSMTVSDSQFVYVLNSNFDQRYTSGWLSILDLKAFGSAPATGRQQCDGPMDL